MPGGGVGIGEISRLHERLSAQRRYNQNKHRLLPLHSAATPAEQRAALAIPKDGVRKVRLRLRARQCSAACARLPALLLVMHACTPACIKSLWYCFIIMPTVASKRSPV